MKKIYFKSLGLAFFSAVLSSFCCVGPLILLLGTLGMSSTSLSTFLIFEPYRNYLITASMVFFAISFYRLYFSETCREECAKQKKLNRYRFFLWITFIISLVLIGFPYLKGFVA
tara:strand:- start:38 stop:379 length:342 start_codon:yes stop_codon:yes gene_type:complete